MRDFARRFKVVRLPLVNARLVAAFAAAAIIIIIIIIITPHYY